MAKQRMPSFDPWRDVNRAQDFAREGVEGFGEQLKPHLLKDIGDTLGGLNSIGALRSGGTTVALNDLTQTYADRIGSFAKESTLGAIGYGQQAGQMRMQDRQQNFREDEAKRNRRLNLMKAIGGVLGAGIGFAVGGPPGAAAGASIGGSVG